MGDGNTYLSTHNATSDLTKWILWVANRDKPLTPGIAADSAALTLDNAGALRITSRGEEPIVLFSSSNQDQSTDNNSTEATLLDSGNFVVQRVNSTDGTRSLLWQSFDYPTNALFPGMKLGVNHKTGRNWSVVSYFTHASPSSGPFSLEWKPKIGQMVIRRRRGQVCWASGELKNNKFENIPVEAQYNVEYYVVSNEDEDSIMFLAKNNDQYSAAWILTSGGILSDMLGNRIATVDECRRAGQTFRAMSIIVNDHAERITTSNDTSVNSAFSDCKAACWSNCYCVGFTNLYKNGTGCYFVHGNSWRNMQNGGSGTTFFVLNNVQVSPTPSKASPVDQGKANSKKGKWDVAVTLFIKTVSIFWLAGTIFWLVIIIREEVKKKRRTMKHMILHLEDSNGDEDGKENHDTLKNGHDLRPFSYASIVEATHGFSSTNKLGEGGFGPVYKGILMHKEVAVKRLSKSSRQGVAEFKTELRIVSELQHTNLVQILGCCIHEDERLLIYEFMPNKSLDFFLFDSTRSKILDWKKRLNIIDGIAQGLLYLHKYSRVRIVHRDLKASNILLDEYMNPKISDFGMARIFMEESEENTARIVGTFGYMPPEYAMGGIFSKKSDVYSFGVLMLEIVSGRRNNSFGSDSNPMNLVGHAWELLKEGRALQLVDPEMHDSVVEDQEVVRCVHIGLLCVEERAFDRPTMSQVLSLLASSSVEMLPLLKKPAFYFDGTVNSVNKSRNHNTGSVNGMSISDFTGR